MAIPAHKVTNRESCHPAGRVESPTKSNEHETYPLSIFSATDKPQPSAELKEPSPNSSNGN